jgi:hypothetical protein
LTVSVVFPIFIDFLSHCILICAGISYIFLLFAFEVSGFLSRGLEMGSCCFRRIPLVLLLSILLINSLLTIADAQGLQTSPYSAADAVRRGSLGGGLDLAPSNPLGLPGSTMGLTNGSSSLYVSDCMLRGILPLIPNLQFGYLYNFGNNRVSSGRFTADYLLPISLSPDSTLFGEAHTEFQDFWKTNSFNNRVDLSFGGGYRTFVRRDTLLGVNGFYDTSRLGGTWYSSGGVGLEMAALVAGNDAVDLNFNWYGQIFNSSVIRNAFRYGPSNFDFQAGYSHELWNGGPDLRLKAAGYKFDIGNSVYGWNAGAELKSRDGMFVLRYDVGHDKVNQTYQTVGGFVNVGLQVENLLKGESPFTMPEPIFKSPRSLRHLLTQPVKRDWHQPAAVIVAQQAATATQQAAGPTPYFVFSLGGPFFLGSMTYTQDPGNATGTMHVSQTEVVGRSYTVTLVGTNGLTFPLTATITPTNAIALVINVRQAVFPLNSPETVTFPDSSTLTRTVPPNGNSGGGQPVPAIPFNRLAGTQGTITITAAGVQTLTITIVAP